MNPEPRLTRQPRGRVIAVMVAWNGRSFLEAAISSVLEALGEHGELLVVENGSTDSSFDFLRAHFPDVAVLQTGENLGGAGGFSAGMRVALEDLECHYVWLLDNDIIVEPGALEPLLDILASAPDIAATGSQLCLYDRPDTVQELGSRYTPWLGALEQQHAGQPRLPADASPREVDYLAACSLLIRSDILRQHGLFREALFVFYDDVEWSLRVRRAGYRLLAVPASVVRHCYGGDKPTVPWREYYRKRNRCICLRLEPPRRGRLLALYFYLVYVNALVRYLAWQGDLVLAGTYRLALDDFDNGRLGRREIVHPAAAPPPLPENACGIWVDTSLSPGDAEAAWKALEHVAVHRKQHLLRLGPNQAGGAEIALVGERYSWTATHSKRLLRYRCGGRWSQITHPRREWLLSRLRLTMALMQAVPAALPRWLRALRRDPPPIPLP